MPDHQHVSPLSPDPPPPPFDPTVPTAPPQNLAIQAATATQLDVAWEPPPVDAQNGDIQGYKVRRVLCNPACVHDGGRCVHHGPRVRGGLGPAVTALQPNQTNSKSFTCL